MQRPVQIIANLFGDSPCIIRIFYSIVRNLTHQLRIDAFIQTEVIIGKQFLLCIIQPERMQKFFMLSVRHDIQMIVIDFRSFFKKNEVFLPSFASIGRKVYFSASEHSDHDAGQHDAIFHIILFLKKLILLTPSKQPRKTDDRKKKQQHFRSQLISQNDEQHGRNIPHDKLSCRQSLRRRNKKKYRGSRQHRADKSIMKRHHMRQYHSPQKQR